MSSSSNSIHGNNVASNRYGVRLWYSPDNSISENNVTGNEHGIYIRQSSNNIFHHNNFVNNLCQVSMYASSMPGETPPTNVWDDGYPSGGNYWSDYIAKGGYDVDGDGIGDIPHVIDATNQDNYPLMEPWYVPTMIKTLIRTIGFSDLPKGTENSLTSKLRGALHLLYIGNENGEMHKLMDFINQVEAQRGKKLTNDHADYLVAEAQRIISLIGGQYCLH